VLPICIGDATRLIEYFPSDKQYRAWITFGKATSTWDAEGDVVQQTSASGLIRQAVENALTDFQGKIQQQVPPHSAVHVNGKKLYQYARKGIAVELPIREAEIFSIQLIEFQQDEPDHPVAVINIHCASGTYVRSIAQALGEALECGAFLSSLTRTAHGKFLLDDSIDLNDFMETAHPELYIQNPAFYLPLPQFALTDENMAKISHGMKLQPDDLDLKIKTNQLYLLLHQNVPVAVAEGENKGRLRPLKVFLHPDHEN
jgi:tRNA pseudouridine55 synthase